MVVLLALGVVVIGGVIVPIVGYQTHDHHPRDAEYRVARVIGLAIVAAGVSITFLPVSTKILVWPPQPGFPVSADEPVGTPSWASAACGTAWNAMFSKAVSMGDMVGSGRAGAAYPHLWIAGGIAAVGISIALWGSSRGWLLAAAYLPLLATGLVQVFALMAAIGFAGTGD